ncbi:argininosuccinate lyase [Pyrobaculum neutrophilum]|uniref:Argininosuccinate lyase n=1 Tax=Pyrobaculum neutrophilum (strain DSM 2338 / JCM 9278 / NBRC 100436 / V24Sta) TaxID=444157 RepID=ARLY_PYRNV|nr:argininosuccinate lyase [Pyrobaculum neutrophilum]B1YB49.1 RecName: Full=Argininosuccinate lyase; Short=ASAL; AltName: Full=Arginosuccinase [Pyrobaculum neutrophilum V24Sta]ACB40749.1 Argininosuccinate lyase [Pyrobaculum neutrophilum V24Sta]
MSFYRSWIGGEGELVRRYTSSIRDDAEIVEEVVKIMEAHVRHLAEVGAAPKEAAEAVAKALREVEPERLLTSEFEDVHEALEKWLVDRLGEEVAGWIGLGRSRNDHVAAAIRLAALRKTGVLKKAVERMRCVLAKRALEYADCAMPSFTHFQPAQAITFGHYLLAVDELAGEFLHVLKPVEELLKRSPLGAGPAGGARAPIDRERVAKLAGFEGVVENALYASGSRFFALALASAVVSFLVELSRAVDDFIRWNSPLVGYVAAPDSHVSTSSIMPHKRNLVTLEVFRARAAEALGHLAALHAVVMKIGMGYSLDLQEATRHLWAVLNIASEGVEVFTDFLEKMSFDCGRARRDAERYYSTSSDTAEEAALRGVPFRRAYFQLAREIREGAARLLPVDEALRRPTRGSANPEEVKRAASARLVFCREKPL